MGERLKGLVLFAIVAIGAWQGYRRFHGGNETHRFGFSAEGPMGCRALLEYGVGDARRTDSHGLPWEGEESESHGNPTVLLRVRAPLSCNLQPEQLHCAVTRDGLPWKQVDARRTTDPSNGDPNGVMCEVERDANLPAE